MTNAERRLGACLELALAAMQLRFHITRLGIDWAQDKLTPEQVWNQYQDLLDAFKDKLEEGDERMLITLTSDLMPQGTVGARKSLVQAWANRRKAHAKAQRS